MRTKSVVASAAAVAGLIAGLPSIPATTSGAAPTPPAASRTTWLGVPPVDPRGAAALVEYRPTSATQTRCIDPLARRQPRA
jgi:hypothetical protein